MEELTRGAALWRQLAERLAEDIARGIYPPGSALPSEAQLMDRYHVSRVTVRSAVGHLRETGIVASSQGVRSTVIGPPPSPGTAPLLDCTVTRTGKTFHTALTTSQEGPTLTRAVLDPPTARLLGRDPDQEEPAFIIDRTLHQDPSHGQDPGHGEGHGQGEGRAPAAVHRMVLPFATLAGTRIQDTPQAEPAEVYAALADAHGPLHWHDTVSARESTPDERATLTIPDTPGTRMLLVSERVTYTTADRPLILEVLRAPATRARLGYRHNPARPSTRHT